MNLSKALIDQGHQVTLWSSDFDHFSKQHRFGTEKTINFSDQLTIRLIKSRGYKSHVGLSRLFDHAQLGWNLKKMLKSESPPDVAFIGYPPIEPAWIMSRWLKLHDTPTILDVKDAWPQVLVSAFPRALEHLVRAVFHPYFVMMKQTLGLSKGISSVSQEFLEWCLSIDGRKQNEYDFVFPLSTQERIFSNDEIASAEKWWHSLKIESSSTLTGYFVGSITDAFDFDPIINTAQKLPVLFVLAGDGPNLESLRARTVDVPNLIFTGRISSAQASILSARSDFSLAPLAARSDFEMSIPNKFYDAMQMGKPMISSLTGPSRRLIEDGNCGFYYQDQQELEEILRRLLKDSDILIEMSRNALFHYNEKFSFPKVYGGATQKLQNLSGI
jgi:glycosyltransferase involved in cell wall biosynthesis